MTTKAARGNVDVSEFIRKDNKASVGNRVKKSQKSNKHKLGMQERFKSENTVRTSRSSLSGEK